MNRGRSLLVAVAMSVLLSGCGTDKIPFVYRIDIEQGNVVDQQMLAQLQPGMSRDQVRFILGSPMLVDPFTEDRWDYVYTFSKSGKRRDQRNLTVLFKDEGLARVIGDVQRAEGEIALADPDPTEVDVPPGGPRRDRGLLANLFSSGPSEEEIAALREAANQPVDEQAPQEQAEEQEQTVEEEAADRRERARVERRRENQEEFYEELLDDLEL